MTLLDVLSAERISGWRQEWPEAAASRGGGLLVPEDQWGSVKMPGPLQFWDRGLGHDRGRDARLCGAVPLWRVGVG